MSEVNKQDVDTAVLKAVKLVTGQTEHKISQLADQLERVRNQLDSTLQRHTDATAAHGIKDTAALETLAGALNKINDHERATDPHRNRADVDAAIKRFADRPAEIPKHDHDYVTWDDLNAALRARPAAAEHDHDGVTPVELEARIQDLLADLSRAVPPQYRQGILRG